MEYLFLQLTSQDLTEKDTKFLNLGDVAVKNSLSQTLSCTIPSESTVCLVACELDRQRRQTDSATLFLTPTSLARSLFYTVPTNTIIIAPYSLTPEEN